MSPTTLIATLRLGLVVSAVAALFAVTLTFVGEVSQWSLAAVVAAVGFTLSWVQTGRLDRGGQPLLVSFARVSHRRPG